MLWSLYYYIIALGKKLVPNKMCVVFFFQLAIIHYNLSPFYFLVL